MKQTLLIAIVAAFAVVPVVAQTNELNLDRCVGLAMEHNQNLQQSRATVQSTSASVSGAFGAFLPSLFADLGYHRHLDNNFPSPNSFSLSGTADYTLFNGFTNTANYERANRQNESAEFTLKRATQDITYQITQDYLNVMRTEQIMKSRAGVMSVDSEQLVRVRTQYDVGTVPRANVLQQETQAANDEVAYLQSKNDWNNAKNDLINLMGIDPGAEYSFSHGSVPDSIPDQDQKSFRSRIGSVQEAISRAIANRYDVAASRKNVDAVQASITSARGGYYPDVSASLSWGWSNSDFNNFSAYSSTTIGLNVSVPIFDQFLTRTSVEVAEASLMTSNATYELLAQQVRALVKKAFYDLETAELQLSATQRALASADENRRTAQERYNLGAGTIVDFITAESQFLTADVNRVNAVYSYLGAKSTVEYLTALMNR